MFFFTKFCRPEHFLKNKKNGYHSVQRLVNVVEQTSLNQIFFSYMILAECGFGVIMEKHICPINKRWIVS